MFLKEKIEIKDRFNGFKVVMNGENGRQEIIIKPKALNHEQYLNSKKVLQENFDNSEVIRELLEVCLEDITEQELNLIMSSNEMLSEVIKMVFVKMDFSVNFAELSTEVIEDVFKGFNFLFNKFIIVLVNYGYKITELENYTQKEIARIAIKEMLCRDAKVFIKFFEDECVNGETGEVFEEMNILYETITDKKNELGVVLEDKVPVKENTGMSDFDLLQSL